MISLLLLALLSFVHSFQYGLGGMHAMNSQCPKWRNHAASKCQFLPRKLMSSESKELPEYQAKTKPKMGKQSLLKKQFVPQTKRRQTARERIEQDWKLVLHNDDQHTITEVVDFITNNCPLCSNKQAYAVSMETHEHGSGIICITNKKLVDEYCAALQQIGLTVSTSPFVNETVVV